MQRTRFVALFVSAALFAAGCGGGSGNDSGRPPTVTAESAVSTASYRSAVNDLFDAIVAARGSYQAAQGEAALRASADAIAKADEAALTRLKAMRIPSSAKTLQAQLARSLKTQDAELKALLRGSKLDTAKLGDAVLMSDDTERLVAQINALP